MNQILCDAIAERLVVRFTYEGKERMVQPHLYGWNSRSRREVLSGVQIAGQSGSQRTYGWKTFYAARIRDLSIVPCHFTPDISFNPEDPSVSIVYCAAEAS